MTEVAPAVTSNQEGDPPLKGTNDETAQFGVEKAHRNSSVDVFRTCADPGQPLVYKAVYMYIHCTTHRTDIRC